MAGNSSKNSMKLMILPLISLATLTTATVHTIHVGTNGADTFTPAIIAPRVGDIIVFQLESFHNIVEGTFNQPCIPKSNGFYSGEFPTTDKGRLRFVTTVTSPDPTYFYCSVGKHCQVGMVGGWNLPANGNTLAAYAAGARSVAEAATPKAIRGGLLLDAAQVAKLNTTHGSVDVGYVANVPNFERDPDFDNSARVSEDSDTNLEAEAIPPWFPPGTPPRLPGIPIGSSGGIGLPGLPGTPGLSGPPPGITGPPSWLPGPPPGVNATGPPWLNPAAFFSGLPGLEVLGNSTSVPIEQITSVFSALHNWIGSFLGSLQPNASVPIRGMTRE